MVDISSHSKPLKTVIVIIKDPKATHKGLLVLLVKHKIRCKKQSKSNRKPDDKIRWINRTFGKNSV